MSGKNNEACCQVSLQASPEGLVHTDFVFFIRGKFTRHGKTILFYRGVLLRDIYIYNVNNEVYRENV